MSNRIQIRRDSTQNWENTNPTLADGEIALEYDTNRIKVGDGQSNWYGLPYINSGVGSLATVATSGSYYDLSNTPPLLDDITGGFNSNNDLRFLRFKNDGGHLEYSSDFRVVPVSHVSYPAGTANQDKIGDVAFDNNFIYYCKAEPNILGTVPLTWAGGYSNQGWITITSISGTNGRPLYINDKVTDGTNTSTVVEIVEGWPGYNGSRQIVRVSPEVPLWHGGSPATLTVLTSGTTATTNCWNRYPAFGAAPASSSANGVYGQMAVDGDYIYACTRSNVTEVSATYATPKSTNTPGWEGGNQRNGASTFTVMVGSSPTPHVGWILSDGTHQRTITSVASAQASVWGQIIDISFSGGDIDWTGLNSITIISTPAVTGQWAKAKWFSGSFNDLTDTPSIPVDVNNLTDTTALLDKEPKFNLKYQNFNAVAGARYCIDAVGSAVTATLPANPNTGDAIYFVDAYGSFNSNNLTIIGNGKTIMGSSTQVISTANESIGVFFNGSEWRFYG